MDPALPIEANELVGWVELLRNPSRFTSGGIDGFRFALPILRTSANYASSLNCAAQEQEG